jgi:MHS family proline/betaine transporter-like MFS transporter
MVLTFMPSYLTRSLKFTAVGSLGVVCIGALVAIVCIPIMGWLSDKYGRRPVNIGSAIATIVLVVPSFLLLQQGLGFAILGIVLLAVAIAGGLNVSQITGLERFPTSIRYTGYATALALCSALFGGTAPYISTFLVASTGNVIAPAFYVVAAAIVTLTVSAMTNETAFKPLPE